VIAGAHLDDLVVSRGGLLLLAGEPGIGKTRLAEEIAARARERGARTAWATAWQGDGAPSMWPWVQILRQLTGSAEALDQAQPETPAASSAARFAQLESIRRQVLQAAAESSLVLFIDDLQWADSGSIRVLAFVAAAIRDAPCLLVATYRSGELSRDDIAELARVGTTLAIPPLADEFAAELLRSAVGAEISSPVINTVVDRSGGNPLFVWEFGQLMAQSGRFDVAPAAVPEAVAAVIERRLARLSEGAVACLRGAAVAGDPFSAPLVSLIAEVTIEEASLGLAAAAASGLVNSTDPPLEFTFVHDLVRDVVLDGLDPVRLAALHHRTALAIEPRLVSDTSFHAVVADHLSRAGPQHCAAASAHWEHAARRAEIMLAFDDAAERFGRAVRSCVDDPTRRGELLVAAGNALLLAGDLDRARERFNEAATTARAEQNAELLARAVLGIGTGPVAWEVPYASDEQVALVADTLALLPQNETRLRSMLLARLSVAAATPETLDLARGRAEEALALAEELGDPALVGQALAALNDALAGPAHTMTRRDNADTIVELAMTAGDRALSLLGYRFLVVADLEFGDVAAVDRHIAAFSRLAEALRQPLVSWYVPLFRGMRAHLAGNLDEAERYHGEVAAAASATGSQNAFLMATTLRLAIDVSRGLRPPPDLLDGIMGVDPAQWATLAAGMAMVKWLAGDHDRARDLLMLHARNHFVHLGNDGEHLTTLLMFGRVAAGLDERSAAEDIYDLLRPHSGLWAVDGIAGCCWGPIDMELGRLAILLNRDTDAREHLAHAQRGVEQVGAGLLAAEIERLQTDATGHSPDVPGAGTRDSTTDAGNVFRHDGQFWTLAYRGSTVRLKDAKGLGDLARLLGQPRRELHVLDLAGSDQVAIINADRPPVSVADLGEVLDARARAEYRRRLAELEDELDDAQMCADLGRAERARVERDFLSTELASALGLGGRPRHAGDPVERARKAVTARIRMTIGRIEREHPALARHLANAVHTGTYCVYAPETTTIWEV
jgi:tetratricopeptide (TPR) repeat protein